ncbi:adenosine deaminase family protein [Kozakia baliensis]|uniref:adenosine deaminase family protein n=1 Tax=Kozakia baliensis TaxID=153496 RepID=UPI00049799C4|nr:adenosine deaminase [Kozakia baliensis]AOX18967.1 adenosine deaminase [Kozakia baliensis]
MFARLAFLALAALLALPAHADEPPEAKATARIFSQIRHDPARLAAFMRAFPKGADLHNHLLGAIYAESLLKWAAQDGDCISLTQAKILPSHCRLGMTGDAPANVVVENADAENAMIDAFSMRNFAPTSTDHSGHDHFFAAFNRFISVAPQHEGDMLAEALDHAGNDHVLYVELMISPALGAMNNVGARHPLPGEDFDAARKALATDLAPIVLQARHETDAMEQRARAILQCDTPQAHPGCAVTARYLFQTIRTMPPALVFAQLAAGYELAHTDPRFVGVNIVAPEDHPIALRDYGLHMRMFQALNHAYPDVKLSLHAGELAPGLVPPEELRHHIRDAVEIAGAKRIGHGADIAWEDNPADLLRDMATRRVMVEINLTSNDEILNLRGPGHPFSLYRKAGVPTALSTDDEGISRGDLTQEYIRAVATWPLSYGELKTISRNGLTYAFIPGKSLWEHDQIITICQAPQSFACASFLHGNEKARLQLALEQNFADFEQTISREPLFQ